MDMDKLAISGGTPVRTAAFPAWPISGPEEERRVLEVLRSGKWGRFQGDQVAEFERRFAAFQGARFAMASVNGTTTMRIALLAAGIEAGEEVIVPPFTFLATAGVVIEANAVPIFVDIEPGTYNLDPRAIEAAITPRTRAIIPVHFGGACADMDPIMAVALRHGLTVIEDAAHAHGATYKGRGAGTLGDMASFSFQASKNITAGEGGILTSNDEPLYRTCFQIHNCGRPFEGTWYAHLIFGANYRMTELQGAVLNAQLDRLAEQTARREDNGTYLAGLLSGIPGLAPQERPDYVTRHSYHGFITRYDQPAWGVSRAAFTAAVQAEGIPLGEGYTRSLYNQPVFLEKRFGPYTGYRLSRPDIDYAAFAEKCPVSERAAAYEATWMPQQALLGTHEDMDDVAEAVAKVYKHREELAGR
jgi:dTDP-4-amino-4,6-dideoxygalactose transaminase